VPSSKALRKKAQELERQQQGVARQQQSLMAQIQTYQGPVPPPAILRELDELVPGCAATILGDAHDQTQHRIRTETRIVGHDIARSWAGLGAGVLVALSALGVALYLASTGHPDQATAVSQWDVVGLASVFVVGAGIRFWERRQKFRELTGL
jgi:uncharacterized membrane protein